MIATINGGRAEMVKILSPRRLFRSRSRSTTISGGSVDICAMVAEHEKIEWEVRPGGMLVQKRRTPEDDAAAVEYILVRVSTGWQWHDVSIDATATFGTSIAVYSSMLRGTALVPGRQELLHRRPAEPRLPPHSTAGFQFQSVVLAIALRGRPSLSPIAVAVDGA